MAVENSVFIFIREIIFGGGKKEDTNSRTFVVQRVLKYFLGPCS